MFIIFFILMTSSHAQKEVIIKGEGTSVRANDFLLTSLRTEVVVDGEHMYLADLIGRATVNASYRRLVRSEIRKVIMPSDAGLIGKNERFEMMVSFPSGEPFIDRNTVEASSRWARKKTHEGSYYVGKTSPGERKMVAEMLLPNPEGKLINVTLYVNILDRDKSYGIKDMMMLGLYPGEILEDNRGRKVVAWDIGGRVYLSVDGTPCISSYLSINGEDKAVCRDNHVVPGTKDLLILQGYLNGNDFQVSNPNTPSAGSKVDVYKYLRSQELASSFTLKYNSHKVEWVAWGRMVGDKNLLYFAKSSDSARICPDGVRKYLDNFVYCNSGYKSDSFNRVISQNLDLFKTEKQLQDDGWVP